MAGFALEEYVVPKIQHPLDTVLGGTFPKAANDKPFYAQAAENARHSPGPEHYHKDFLSKGLADKAVGGQFSKVSRNAFGNPKGKSGGACVGQYDVHSALTTPRTRGGQMSKRDRGCFFYDQAIRTARHHQAPGKYEPVFPAQSPRVVSFSPRRPDPSEARAGQSGVGPGQYTVNFNQVEIQPPSYSTSKEVTTSHIDKHVKTRSHVLPSTGNPEPKLNKVVDLHGAAKHVRRLL
eukprot:CAMPEP_0178427702 /NCGR_PEP_ID=MMETSP0689_2-20121128/29882_1 /TAXON_ID=160604 /ORGANISM="Amphidinium massartii, Strain CS-259" /LENGTH=234 /DNA_ID=CAMNT_0020049419 /DNA_START=83 /DNA_END=783 /DNA_ORIENTATION=+